MGCSCLECGYEDEDLKEGFHYCPICDMETMFA